MKLSIKRKWVPLRELKKKYLFKQCRMLDLQEKWVETKAIIGLSKWPPERLMNHEKMKRLRFQFARQGLANHSAADIQLLKLPSGEYTVYAKGDYLVLLAAELHVPRVLAEVKLLIPEYLIRPHILEEIKKLEKEISLLEKEAAFYQLGYYSSGISSVYTFKEQESFIRELFQIIDDVKASIQYLLQREAKRLHLFPEQRNSPKINFRAAK